MLDLGERAAVYEIGVILKVLDRVQGATEDSRILGGHPYFLFVAGENPRVEKLFKLRLEVVVLLGARLIPL